MIWYSHSSCPSPENKSFCQALEKDLKVACGLLQKHSEYSGIPLPSMLKSASATYKASPISDSPPPGRQEKGQHLIRGARSFLPHEHMAYCWGQQAQGTISGPKFSWKCPSELAWGPSPAELRDCTLKDTRSTKVLGHLNCRNEGHSTEETKTNDYPWLYGSGCLIRLKDPIRRKKGMKSVNELSMHLHTCIHVCLLPLSLCTCCSLSQNYPTIFFTRLSSFSYSSV